MTLSDFVKRLQGFYDGKNVFGNAKPTAQVKIGKDIDDTEHVFDYFDIKRVGEDIVLVPSDRWSKKEGSR